MSLVSIIIPTYNRAHLISETLDSIIAQTYTIWECIIVDDGSTDNTDTVVKAYVDKDTRFQYRKRPNNRPKGANACRNYGFEISRGDFVNWFDSDDLMKPNFISEKLNIFNSEKEAFVVVLCECEIFSIKENKKEIISYVPINYNDFLSDLILKKFHLSMPAGLWTSKYLKKAFSIKSLFDEQLSQSQDYDFYIRIFKNNPMYKVINKALFEYRKSLGSISADFIMLNEEHINSYLKVRHKILSAYGDNQKVYNGIINQILAGLQSALNKKQYDISSKYLAFLRKQLCCKSFSDSIFYFKISVLSFVCKFFGQGATYLKNHFRYQV
ncbi:glycosyltransferase family 2 protein [Olleya sp. AH-315-F22]|nr:glycosyltransferase family 2 protein [Olleya sp. AH-315-F22]